MALILETESNIPAHGYREYSGPALEFIHRVDQFLTPLSTIYALVILVLYCYQSCILYRKRKTHDRAIIPIHLMGISCLLVTTIYCALLFIDAHSIREHFPLIRDSCLTEQRIHLMSLVVVKTLTTLTFVFNLSYLNQNPFFNPRYKYLSKKRRKFLRALFRSIKLIVAIFLPVALWSAYRRAQCDSFQGPPDDFEYCFMTFTTKSFFLIFGVDAVGVVVFALLFGRNACKCTARGIKIDANQSDVNLIDPDDRSLYDDDDPIQHSLDRHSIGGGGSVLSYDRSIEPAPAGGLHDHGLLVNSTASDSRKGSQSLCSAPFARESIVIGTDYVSVSALEKKGIKELTRSLRLIWFMFIFYWMNLISYAILGLYTSTACIALMLNTTCILLLNDYEFSSNYWKGRDTITSMCCSCCWMGVRKASAA